MESLHLALSLLSPVTPINTVETGRKTAEARQRKTCTHTWAEAKEQR